MKSKSNNSSNQEFLVIQINYNYNIKYILYERINELIIKIDNINQKYTIKGIFSEVIFNGNITNKIEGTSLIDIQFVLENQIVLAYYFDKVFDFDIPSIDPIKFNISINSTFGFQI